MLALHTANQAAIVTLATDPYQKRIYRQGYTDALVSLAVAFGIPIESMPKVNHIADGTQHPEATYAQDETNLVQS